MNRTLASILIAVLAGAGFVGLGYWYGTPKPVVETAAPEVKQADGSIVAVRAPDAKARPKQQVPKGAKVERLGAITVQGKTPEANLRFPGAVPCPPVSIDTTLVHNADGSRRLIVSSPDGRVTRAVDIPVETAAAPPEPRKWAAGLSYEPVKQTFGVWIERDVFERVRLGVEINQTRQDITSPVRVEGRLKVGWTF